ncbi:SGNH/GDSL hydrolase family protein [Dyadobacter sediminis]|uniref:SGNH/GDSL hydrolase family protein n=1 Tax=Dyadobacter sediminis TaxID=1493691 RepID=A0A5R9KJL5_9BACT|nr:SGNH/GDSL hydrolase family protein [Dyadobacter sediminis]TLU96410.1 SGNH/GDSL hydrolase family protein [Dyadobacter sediminis]GGB82013.1 hypothetical protein GCM10011325_06890 [Dyadobacter sediminis]
MHNPFYKYCIFILITAFWSCKNDDITKEEELIKRDSCVNYIDSLQAVNKETSPAPISSLRSGNVAFGTLVYFYNDSLHHQTAIEISLDSGKTWLEKRCAEIRKTGAVQARYKNSTAESASTKLQFKVYYKRVLIIGNSITINGPLPEKGWMGNWGMAASDSTKDYVHLLSSNLKALNPEVDIVIRNYAEFERSYWWYNFNSLQTLTEFKPDLLIMRIAENTNKDNLYSFQAQYARFIKTLIAKSSAKVICTNSFWKGLEDADNIIKDVTIKDEYIYCDLSSLRNDPSYRAFKQFSDESVGSHPSDKGMKAIAELIAKNL